MRRAGRTAIKAVLAMLAVLVALPGLAQERGTLGWGRLVVNDALGDGADRWRTGSVVVSRITGPEWTGQLPPALGEVLEWRAIAEVISPLTLLRASPRDRRYAGVLGFGLHSHARMLGWETRLGADLFLIGPQTGLDDVQRALHDLAGLPAPVVAARQIGDRVRPTLSAEMARPMAPAAGVMLRPFVEAQVGLEDYLRIGVDLTLGRFGQGALLLRDPVSGQRYQAVRAARSVPGLSLMLGADLTRVWQSTVLPETGLAVAEPRRKRLRAGLQWQSDQMSAFYGVTLLGREFTAQPEEQLVGAISLRLRF